VHCDGTSYKKQSQNCFHIIDLIVIFFGKDHLSTSRACLNTLPELRVIM